MDDSLFIEYIKKLYFRYTLAFQRQQTLMKRLAGKLLCGPVVLKVNSGPERIVANEQSSTKGEELMEKGLYILLGLPNATAV
jgi:hypothetical protein